MSYYYLQDLGCYYYERSDRLFYQHLAVGLLHLASYDFRLLSQSMGLHPLLTLLPMLITLPDKIEVSKKFH